MTIAEILDKDSLHIKDFPISFDDFTDKVKLGKDGDVTCAVEQKSWDGKNFLTLSFRDSENQYRSNPSGSLQYIVDGKDLMIPGFGLICQTFEGFVNLEVDVKNHDNGNKTLRAKCNPGFFHGTMDKLELTIDPKGHIVRAEAVSKDRGSHIAETVVSFIKGRRTVRMDCKF